MSDQARQLREIVKQFSNGIKQFSNKKVSEMVLEVADYIESTNTKRKELDDIIEQQQKRISELEHRAEEAEIKLSIVLDKQDHPDSYKCVVYDLTPLEAEKKLQDSIKRIGWLPPDEATTLRQERDELSAAVDVLREYLRSLVEESTGVVGWHLNGAVADWDEIGATDILGETPRQNLNAVKREVAIEAFLKGAEWWAQCELNDTLYLDEHQASIDYANTKYPSGKDNE